MRKRIISLLLICTLLLSFGVNVSAANNDTDNDTNKVSATVAAATTHVSKNGTASGYYTINFNVPTREYCSILIGGKGLNTNTGVWAIMSGPAGQVLNINTPSDGSGYLTHKTLPAGNYTITLYNSDTYFYNVNVYKY